MAEAPSLALPRLPEAAEARAETLARLAAEIVAHLGPVTALALAAALDEAVADGAVGR